LKRNELKILGNSIETAKREGEGKKEKEKPTKKPT